MLSAGNPNPGSSESETWLLITASYFDPIVAGRTAVLNERFGEVTIRQPWAHVHLAEASISEYDYDRRQRALEEFLITAAEAIDEVRRIVGHRATRADGFVSLGLTLHSSEADGGVSIPDWFMSSVFSEPGEFNIS